MAEKTVKLTLRGCDDSTSITIGVNEEQHEFLQKLETMFEAASTYGCMPVLSITEPSAPPPLTEPTTEGREATARTASR